MHCFDHGLCTAIVTFRCPFLAAFSDCAINVGTAVVYICFMCIYWQSVCGWVSVGGCLCVIHVCECMSVCLCLYIDVSMGLSLCLIPCVCLQCGTQHVPDHPPLCHQVRLPRQTAAPQPSRVRQCGILCSSGFSGCELHVQARRGAGIASTVS